MEKTILVTGATGTQGGAVARHLLAGGWHVRGLTRDPNKPAARALADQGVELVKGDLYNCASLDHAVKDVYGVFSVQNYWLPEVGAEGEVRQGKNLADAAKAAGVEHFVYSSVGGAERNTGLAHFESKWQIEQYIRALGLAATIFRPVAFMENFNWNRSQILNGTFLQPLPAQTKLQLIAADDIGAFVRIAFKNPQEFIRKALEIAGDELTQLEIAQVFGRVIGRPVQFVQQPLEQPLQFNPEGAKMRKWFEEEGYKADIPDLRAIYPQLMTLETWLRQTGWDQAQLERA
ncbi:MAG: NmrA/HSCARG family protein [Chloroflexi bacterium]|nr:NmrA/HSCARG family protein [Chloroflexota bacterium]